MSGEVSPDLLWRVEPTRRHTSTMDDDAVPFDMPNCPECLVRLEIAGTEQHPYFVCPVCHTAFLGQVRIA